MKYMLCLQKKKSAKNIHSFHLFSYFQGKQKKHSPTYHLVILPGVAEQICREMLGPEKRLVVGGIRWTFVIGGYQKTGFITTFYLLATALLSLLPVSYTHLTLPTTPYV